MMMITSVVVEEYSIVSSWSLGESGGKLRGSKANNASSIGLYPHPLHFLLLENVVHVNMETGKIHSQADTDGYITVTRKKKKSHENINGHNGKTHEYKSTINRGRTSVGKETRSNIAGSGFARKQSRAIKSHSF
jgi:hypothetical protein